jgi:hypothetical protein
VKNARRWVSVIGIAIGVIIFWAAIVAIGAQTVFGVSKNVSFFFLGIPIGAAILIWLWPKLPKILGFE